MDSDQLVLALDLMAGGQSLRETARQFFVSKDYLKRRIDGVDTRETVNSKRQALSLDLE